MVGGGGQLREFQDNREVQFWRTLVDYTKKDNRSRATLIGSLEMHNAAFMAVLWAAVNGAEELSNSILYASYDPRCTCAA